MRQVFRLMGMPDKVIAFDALPKDLIEGLELHDCSRLPKDWREFIGYRDKSIKIKPELNPITRQLETFNPVTVKAPWAYLIDWEINNDKERWAKIEDFVKRHAPKDFRLTDKLIDMAKPMAADPHSELNLEVEDVIVIPLESAEVENEGQKVVTMYKCDLCEKEFDTKQGVIMHKTRVHSDEAVQQKENVIV